MKAKLTITLDPALVPEAKKYARSRGISLSSLIEESLAERLKRENKSFVQRWRGGFEPAQKDDGRYRQLADKYL